MNLYCNETKRNEMKLLETQDIELISGFPDPGRCTPRWQLVARFLIIWLMFQPICNADLIEFADGSNIFGKINKIENGKISIHTLFAGNIEVDQDQIAGLIVEDDVHILLKDGRQLFGAINIEPDPSYSSIGEKVLKIDISKVYGVWREGDNPVTQKADKFIVPSKEPRWKYDASLNIAGRTGNSETLATAGSVTATLLGAKDQLKLFFSVDQAEDNDNKTSDEFKGGFDIEAGFPENHSGFIRAEAERDEIEAIDLRLTAATGYGYYFLKNGYRQLRGRIGLVFRHEDIIENGSQNDPGFEVGLFSLFRIDEKITLKMDISHLQGIDDISDFRSIHESSLEFPLSKDSSWKVRLGMLNEFDNEPATNKKRLDTRFFMNFVLSWDQPHLIYIKLR